MKEEAKQKGLKRAQRRINCQTGTKERRMDGGARETRNPGRAANLQQKPHKKEHIRKLEKVSRVVKSVRYQDI